MSILVIGATGATGRLLVEELLSRGLEVNVLVRSPEKLPDGIQNHQNLTVKKATVLDLGEQDLRKLVGHCDAVASCLGHNLSLKGMYGKPRRLVRDSVQKLCQAILTNTSGNPVKFVLMNTSGNSNRDLAEKLSFGERAITGLIRLLLPPFADNEQAADYLRSSVGQQHPFIEWVVVRPDSLINEEEPSRVRIHPSPIRSALFHPGKTSRINVARFMADLITDDAAWNTWRGQMPVIYNVDRET
jgi:nucleoside-diphosphate-sugar epimerase